MLLRLGLLLGVSFMIFSLFRSRNAPATAESPPLMSLPLAKQVSDSPHLVRPKVVDRESSPPVASSSRVTAPISESESQDRTIQEADLNGRNGLSAEPAFQVVRLTAAVDVIHLSRDDFKKFLPQPLPPEVKSGLDEAEANDVTLITSHDPSEPKVNFNNVVVSDCPQLQAVNEALFLHIGANGTVEDVVPLESDSPEAVTAIEAKLHSCQFSATGITSAFSTSYIPGLQKNL